MPSGTHAPELGTSFGGVSIGTAHSYYAQCLIIALIIAPRAIMDLAPIIAKSIIALIIRIIARIIVCAIMRAII